MRLGHDEWKTDLVLFEVTQSFDNNWAAALLLGVSGFQSHNVFGAADQMLNLPLVFHDLLPLPLEIIEKKLKKKKRFNGNRSVTDLTLEPDHIHLSLTVLLL